MNNPLYNSIMGQQPNIMSALQNLKQNPMQFIMQAKFNVPQDIVSDPNAIIQHLMNTGQVSQQRYNQVVQMTNQFK